MLVPLIKTLQGSYRADQKDSHDAVIITIKWSHEGIR